jgi:hypothetical protein
MKTILITILLIIFSMQVSAQENTVQVFEIMEATLLNSQGSTTVYQLGDGYRDIIFTPMFDKGYIDYNCSLRCIGMFDKDSIIAVIIRETKGDIQFQSLQSHGLWGNKSLKYGDTVLVSGDAWKDLYKKEYENIKRISEAKQAQDAIDRQKASIIQRLDN